MNNISEQALKNRPKKPLNAYFKFRTEKLAEFKDDQDRTKKVKQAWDSLDEKIKDQMNNYYKLQIEKYRCDHQDWKKKYNIDDEDLKHKKKRQQENIQNRQEEKIEQNNYQHFYNKNVLNSGEKRIMKANQLASLLERIGGLLINLAPHIALLGHTEEPTNYSNSNQVISTHANEQLINLPKTNQQNGNNKSFSIECQKKHEKDITQAPILNLSQINSQIMRLHNIIEAHKETLQTF